MIKILEQKKHIVTCEKCETKFSYEKEDAVIRQMGMNEWEETVKCPVCGNEIGISQSQTR